MTTLIKIIAADPDVALYVQHLKMNRGDSRASRGNEFGEDYKHERTRVQSTASALMRLGINLMDPEYLSVEEVQEWNRGLQFALDIDLLALEIFPNLTSIEIREADTVVYSQFFDLSRLLIKIILRSTDRKSTSGPFSKLISITIGAVCCSSVAIGLIEAFATLPSIKMINAEGIGSNGNGPRFNMPMISSNVTDLNLSNADLIPPDQTLLLQSFERLQSFTYWTRSVAKSSHDFEPILTVTALLAYARDTLKELYIRGGYEIQASMGILCKFRVLEYVETDARFVLDNLQAREQNFSVCLPPSIQVVKLHDWHENSPYLSGILLNIQRNRNQFPGLRSIECFDFRTSAPEEARLQKMCATMNISLKVDSEGVSLPVYTRHRRHYAERQAKKALTQGEGR